ncbi:probable serine/threonine-protein kinase DDB_G0282963 isoform X1 [Bactrocera tryoni]|uniref:probable serine/threonine-protein kinase DDB_G0282963 isoform X1 n=2 Tax=Bactrocera tryoni TaxID=59916 RepID=UPI001A986E28|nr:probable serine/threonine-protein kinase DDB_G0282963 isoform X1 [Bactrocera tryoni]XP_039964905.1 probable serine/threonine-protein kinase DDB_G0282963 isoform X1 [Bactrocera tryoni]
MAKTRIKTTPTRLQKDALMASAGTVTAAAAITKPVLTTYQTAASTDDVKKRLRNSALLPKPMQSGTSTIIVTAPKRTNSISSIASSISQISDAHSDTESPPPPSVASTTTTKSTKSLLTTNTTSQAPRTLNSLLCKPTPTHSAPRNRKVFMITEKSDEPHGAETSSTATAGATTGQKRKMYLIMEENSCAEDGEEDEGDDALTKDAHKYLKRENGLIVGAGGSKKLTLFADKADSGTLTEKFEKILPEILNRIQAKDTSGAAPVLAPLTATSTPAPAPTPTVTSKLLNGSTNLNVIKSEPMQHQQQQQSHFQLKQEHNNKAPTEANNERLPITLPPKKNRTKIITTHLQNAAYNGAHFTDNANSVWGNYNNNSSGSNNHNNNSSQKIGAQCHIKQISAATPVIVSAVTMNARHNNNSNNNSHANNTTSEIKRFAPKQSNNISTTNNTNIRYASNCNGQAVTSMAQVELVPQKNINLSTDFHFLIKMLPKLESIPEPHKNNVKNCIEKIITQNANIFAKQ